MDSQLAVDPPVQLADGGWAIPDSAAGHRLAWVLNAINSPALAAAARTKSDAGGGVPDAGPSTDITADATAADGGYFADAGIDFEEAFSSAYLEQVTAGRMAAVLTDMAAVAPWEIVSYEGFMSRQVLTTVLKNGGREYWRLLVQVDDAGKIVRLLVSTAADLDPTLTSLEGIDAALAALEGKTQWSLFSLDANGPTAIHSFNPDLSMAVASSFKLWVLAALANSISSGERTWTDLIPIQDKYKSFPSGRMQDEPEGATFSIEEFALNMISRSDNTAADHLLFTVGRDKVEAMVTASGHHAPAENLPFLSARELFSMRLVVPPQEQQEYVDAPVERRREILAHIDESLDPRTAPQALWNTPIRIDQIEWFATSGDLCRIMNTLRSQMVYDQPLIQVFLSQNVGTDVPTSPFNYIGYKGGSETGVVSRTWLIKRASDLAWRCVTFTWNDTLRDVDMNRAAYIGEAIAASAGKW